MEKKYVTKKFIKSTWDKYPEKWWQILRLSMYKNRIIRTKSNKEFFIEDVRKQGYLEPEFKINGKWISVSKFNLNI